MKWLHVLKREYLAQARTKSFIIGTLVAPVFIAALYSLPILGMLFVPDEQISVAILDHTGRIADDFVATLDDTLKSGKPKYITTIYSADSDKLSDYRTKLTKDISDDRLDVLIEIPAAVFDKGQVNYISKDVMNEIIVDSFRDRLNPLIISARFADLGVDTDRIHELTRRIRLNEQKITKSGIMEEKAVMGELILVIVFVVMLYIMLLSWGITIMKSILEEKSSRVIEVMLSSLEPKDMFIGKVLGLGALGFTQVIVWMLLGLGLASGVAVVASQLSGFVSLTVVDVLYFVLFFVLGFLFYASLFTIIGSVCSTDQDAQQLQMFAMSPLIIAMMMVFLVIQNPNSDIAVILSMIPFFTPMILLARVLIAEPPLWQVLLGLAILVVSIYGVIWFSARVYRVGILMYGKRPSLREVARWARYS